MYQEYWHLSESPFRGGLDLSSFYPTANHDEALARLNFLVEERRRLGLLSGPAGIGKSLLVELFAQQIRDSGGEVARTNLTGSDAQDFLWSLAAQFGLNPELSATPFVLWRRLADFLIQCRYQRTQLLMLLDDADAADPQVFDLILRLAQVDPHVDSRLTIVLVAADDRLDRLPAPLLELAELAITLEPWAETDTAGFLDFALRQAGRQAPLFTADAARRLHALAGGIPLRLKQLADLALLAGAGLELVEIDADAVQGAFQELGLIVNKPAAKAQVVKAASFRGGN